MFLFETTPTFPSLTGFRAVGLHGTLNLQFGPAMRADQHWSRLNILFGGNGSGKTSVLRAMVNLLSPEPNGRHRTELARTEFRLLEVALSNGLRLTAERANERLIGDYTLTARHNEEIGFSQRIKVDHEWNVKSPTVDSYCDFIRGLSPAIRFLDDQRRLISSEKFEFYFSPAWEGKGPISPPPFLPPPPPPPSLPNIPPNDPSRRESGLGPQLQEALWRLRFWFGREVRLATGTGEDEVNSVFNELFHRMSIASSPVDAALATRTANALKEIAELADISAKCARFGFTTPLRTEEIIGVLRAASPHQQRMLAPILELFIEANRARLRSLERLESVAERLVHALTEFMQFKLAHFDVDGGLKFAHRTNLRAVSPLDLSSGEKQLVLILSNLVTSRSQETLFLIDEPEMSLNFDWQRELCMQMLNMISDSPTQLIIATHSLEILSRHREHTIQLQPL